MGSILDPKTLKVVPTDAMSDAQHLKCEYEGLHWPQTGATQCHAHLGLSEKGRAIKALVVCEDWDLEPLDLLNCLALNCY